MASDRNVSISGHEAGKDRRRRAIVQAARRLMQKTGRAGFSMRALAEEAGVSVPTPYNLFGSKQAIMYAVLDTDIEHYGADLDALAADEIGIFFEAVTVAVQRFGSEPAFHKAVLSAVYNEGGKEYRAMFSAPRHAMWRKLVVAAQNAGLIARHVNADAFALQLGRSFFASILEWVHGELSLDELHTWAQYGFALLLLGVATARSADELDDRMRALQKQLGRLWRQRQVAIEESTAVRAANQRGN